MSTAVLDDKGVVLTCLQCGQKNRTPFARIAEQGECGRCHNPLPPLTTPVDITRAAQFDRLVEASALPVVVDFWAPWCGPCKMVAPELVKVAASAAGKFLVTKINTEELPDLARRFSIQSIPTMSVFYQGRELGRTSGARPAAAIETFVRDAVSKSDAAKASV